jgi:outer membrane protein assembly factor BamD (BamD/ComL family)
MAEGSRKQDWVSKLALAAVFVSLVAGGAALIVSVILWASGTIPMSPGLLAIQVLAMLSGALWLLVAYGVVVVIVRAGGTQEAMAARIDRVEALLESQDEDLRKLIDLATLSNRAKGLLYRDRELDAFREALHADLMKQDYNSAQRLIESIEEQGYVDEAARLGREIADARSSTNEEKVEGAIARIEQIISRHDWDRAHREASRLVEAYPDNAKVQELPRRIERARNTRKRELLQQYGEAVRKNAVDEGISLLKKLDSYLTPQEAAALRDSARGVFRAKLHNLGVQFAISVTDHRWSEAVTTGEQIMRDFPNTRMAQEVREKIDTLRNRAAGASS